MAFPTTSVLDSFTRADGALGANWGTPVTSGNPACKVATNQIAPNVDTGNSPYADGYWSAATFGPDSECYATVTSVANAARALYARVVNPGNASTLAGYDLQSSFGAVTTWGLYEITNNVETLMGATFTQTVSANDAIGIDCIGTTIAAHYKASGGSWTTLASRTNSAHSAAGNIGVSMQPGSGSANRMDDFAGGTISGGAAAVQQELMLLGVGS